MNDSQKEATEPATSRKTKVLFAINEFKMGGAQNMLVDQVRSIDLTAFDPRILSIFAGTDSSVKGRVEALPIAHEALAFRSLFDVPSWLRLYRYLKRERFDVVITNLFDTNLIVRIAAICIRVPVILSWEHNVYRNKRVWQIFADRVLARFTYRILVGAPQVKEFVTEQEHLPSQMVEVVFDAAELVFKDVRKGRNEVLEKYELPQDSLYIIACGRIEEQKGHRYLIEAFRSVLDKDPAADLRLVIFGEGVDRDALVAQIREANLQDRVLLPGIAPMSDILAMSDIFCLISLWEGFSIALIQAMNAGCAVLASRVSGSVDAIQDGVNGLLVPPADADAAAHALAELIADPDRRAAFGKSAHEKSKQFGVQAQMRRIEAIMRAGLNPH